MKYTESGDVIKVEIGNKIKFIPKDDRNSEWIELKKAIEAGEITVSKDVNYE